MFTFKVVKNVAKNVFQVKKIDEKGNSLGCYDETFPDQTAAQQFADELAGGKDEKTAAGDTHGEAPAPEAPKVGEENHSSGTAPGPDDKDHYIEISAVEQFEGKTSFKLVNYYLNADGTKTVKGSQDESFDGELTVDEVIAKVEANLVEKGWTEKVVWAEETTVVPV